MQHLTLFFDKSHFLVSCRSSGSKQRKWVCKLYKEKRRLGNKQITELYVIIISEIPLKYQKYHIVVIDGNLIEHTVHEIHNAGSNHFYSEGHSSVVI